MPADYDATEFVDGDFQPPKSGPYGAAAGPGGGFERAPSREEVDSKVGETQQKLAELKRAQEELERQRASLEETRRRQAEFQTGRQEMVQHLTRGTALLEEAEFAARRDAEQLGKALGGLKDALTRIQGIQESGWTKDNFDVELTRALTAVENARMEWNGARLKFPVLNGTANEKGPEAVPGDAPAMSLLAQKTFGQLCRVGFALTWPLALIMLLALAVLLVILLRG